MTITATPARSPQLLESTKLFVLFFFFLNYKIIITHSLLSMRQNGGGLSFASVINVRITNNQDFIAKLFWFF